MEIDIKKERAVVEFYAEAVQNSTTLISKPQYDEKEKTFTAHVIVHLTMNQLSKLRREVWGRIPQEALENYPKALEKIQQLESQLKEAVEVVKHCNECCGCGEQCTCRKFLNKLEQNKGN